MSICYQHFLALHLVFCAQSSMMKIMGNIAFDTLSYSKKLKAAGFTEKQAEVQAEAIAELVEERLATKRDLKEMEERLMYRLTIRLGAMLAASIGVVAALVKIL